MDCELRTLNCDLELYFQSRTVRPSLEQKSGMSMYRSRKRDQMSAALTAIPQVIVNVGRNGRWMERYPIHRPSSSRTPYFSDSSPPFTVNTHARFNPVDHLHTASPPIKDPIPLGTDEAEASGSVALPATNEGA